MTPEEIKIAVMFGVGLTWTLAALALGYGNGLIDGRADKKLWTEEEINQKMRSN